MKNQGTLLVATDPNWLIGDRPDPTLPGTTPWQGELPADMHYFQGVTEGQKVLFTIPTYHTIPERFRPLRGREVGLYTRKVGYSEDGCPSFNNLDQAFDWAGEEELIIAGGGQLYSAALKDHRVNRILRTVVCGDFTGNVYFPDLGVLQPAWKLVRSEAHEADDKNKHSYRFEEYLWNIFSRDDIPVLPEETRLVDPRNARSRMYVQQLLRYQNLGGCPFCAGGWTMIEDEIEDQDDLCWLKVSHSPIGSSLTHLVVAPMRHCRRESDLTDDEARAMRSMRHRYLKNHGLELYSGLHFNREGRTEETGATVCHYHENFTIPRVVDGESPLITVNCGVWRGEPGWLTQ